MRRNLSELVIPGILLRYDTTELAAAMSPRRLTLLNPANALGQPMRLAEARAAWEAVLAGAEQLGEPDRVRLLRRDFRDPLPIP